MTTAFVLSGGASHGAIQVGMLQALAERDVHPDLLIGTSAGAVNAAYVAGHGTGGQALDELAATWRGLRRGDVFPFDPLRHLLALAGRSDGRRDALLRSKNEHRGGRRSHKRSNQRRGGGSGTKPPGNGCGSLRATGRAMIPCATRLA